MGKGYLPFQLPNPLLSSDPTSSGPHPRTPCGRVSQPPRLPSPRSPPSFHGLEARDSQSGTQSATSRFRRGRRPGPGPGPSAGAHGHWGCRGARRARKGAAAKDGTRALERPLRSLGASLSRTSSPPEDKQIRPVVTDAFFPGTLLTRSSQLPDNELGWRRGAKSEPGASPRPWRSPGYRRLPLSQPS